jgi:hypothetical protein
MCVGFSGMTSKLWLKGNTVTEQFRVYGGVGDESLDELLHLLHVLIHVLVWCYDSQHLMLKYQAPIYEMADLKNMIDKVIC